ncbi:MAG TPA: hypothetical protein VFD00_05985 [Thermoclostridium sp.]|nr:hypothetical protein [Thermoclostridium sp.]
MLKMAEDVKKVVPTDKLFRKGDNITYKGTIYTRKNKRQVIQGIVDYVTPYIVGVRESSGQMQTFTAVDLFTGDVKIIGSEIDLFAMLLGLENDPAV